MDQTLSLFPPGARKPIAAFAQNRSESSDVSDSGKFVFDKNDVSY